MQKRAHAVAAKVGLVSLAALAFTVAGPTMAPAQRNSQARFGRWYRNVERLICPCAAHSFFASFLNGQRQLLSCTNNTPADAFVRLVDTNIDLVALFEFPPQKYCGWQPNGDSTSFLPVTTGQFAACKHLFIKAAANQGMPCVPELPIGMTAD